MTNEINNTTIKDYEKGNNPLKPIVPASEFYVLGIKNRITKTSEGLDTFKDWSDLVNNKEGWKELGIAKATLLIMGEGPEAAARARRQERTRQQTSGSGGGHGRARRSAACSSAVPAMPLAKCMGGRGPVGQSVASRPNTTTAIATAWYRAVALRPEGARPRTPLQVMECGIFVFFLAVGWREF